MDNSEDINSENIFQILLATDNHLGYGENHQIRENDSFVTFEEILQIAVRENVDFILLGGDLFHDTRPSPYCINKCTELIRKYCVGDKPVEIEFLSDPSYNFQRSLNPLVNYEDPNINIAIPIFSIHGNHDDPTGKKQISAMDLMSSMGLINYFGRWDDLTRVEVNPILLKKGESHLALYGLSHIRDERLARLFLDKKVIMKTPENVNEWFNLLVLHQNRANRGAKNFIAETFIPEFVDLVMWGHEHDCKIEPVKVAHGNAYITQPGSSVATSLAEGEALTKKVALLHINKTEFNITPIELHTVRPFIFKQISLDPPQGLEIGMSHANRAKEQIKNVIEDMIRQANELGRKRDLIPLIRLLVKYTDERQIFNAIRFGHTFVDRVANPEDLIKFVSKQKKTRKLKSSLNNSGDENFDDDDDDDGDPVERVEDLLLKYFNEKNKLSVLSLTGLNEAVKKFVDANDNDSVSYIINYQQEKTLEKLNELRPEKNDVKPCLERLRAARERETDEFKQILNSANRPKLSSDNNQILDSSSRPKHSNDNTLVINIDDSDDDSISTPIRPLKGPGSRGGRGSRGGGRGSRGPRGGRNTRK